MATGKMAGKPTLVSRGYTIIGGGLRRAWYPEFETIANVDFIVIANRVPSLVYYVTGSNMSASNHINVGWMTQLKSLRNHACKRVVFRARNPELDMDAITAEEFATVVNKTRITQDDAAVVPPFVNITCSGFDASDGEAFTEYSMRVKWTWVQNSQVAAELTSENLLFIRAAIINSRDNDEAGRIVRGQGRTYCERVRGCVLQLSAQHDVYACAAP